MNLCMSTTKVKVTDQSSRSQDKRHFFTAMHAISLLKSESEVKKTSYDTVLEKGSGNDTVPVAVWRGGATHSTKCYCSSWLFVDLSMPKCSVRPRVKHV